jgi:hypothetical protein
MARCDRHRHGSHGFFCLWDDSSKYSELSTKYDAPCTTNERKVWKVKAIRVCICGLGLLMLLAQCALCASIWTEEKISTSTVGTRGSVKVCGDEVYWSDNRSGKTQVYVWDRAQGERVFLSDAVGVGVWAAYEDSLVIGRKTGSQTANLFLYDPVNGERLITTGLSTLSSANVYGNTVVYEDHSTSVSQVHIWDPVNGNRAIAPSSNNQITPKIYGNTVVWEEGYTDPHDGYKPSVYMWDPLNGKRLVSEGMRSPAVYGDKIAMFAPDDYPYAYSSDLYEYSISSGNWNWCTWADSRTVFETQMWGDMVVWSDYSMSPNVYAWDPVHGKTTVNQSHFGSAHTPSVYGRYVVWTDRSSVYLSTVVPEPSALAGLALGLMGIAPRLRRRRREH